MSPLESYYWLAAHLLPDLASAVAAAAVALSALCSVMCVMASAPCEPVAVPACVVLWELGKEVGGRKGCAAPVLPHEAGGGYTLRRRWGGWRWW